MTCKTCSGEGISITYENQAPLGSGMVWNEEIIDDCPDCTGEGICPSCDKKWSDETYEDYINCVSSWKAEDFCCPFCDWKNG